MPMTENLEPYMRHYGFSRLVKFTVATPAEVFQSCTTRSLDIIHIGEGLPPSINTEAMPLSDDPSRYESFSIRFLITETDFQNTNWLQMPKRIAAWISVLFGKLVTNPSLLQTSSEFHLPQPITKEKIWNRKIPFYSDFPRVEYPTPLDFGELKILEQLVFDTSPQAMMLHSAAEFYAKALRNWLEEPEHAFVNLVTAGECLLGLTAYEWHHLADENAQLIASSLRYGEDPDKLQRIYESQIRFLGEQYARLLTDSLPPSVFNQIEYAVDENCRFSDERIKKSIKNSYSLRSKYVHTGATFGVYTSIAAARAKAEMWRDFSVAENYGYSEAIGISQEDVLKIIKNSATFIGLERVVRHAIIRLLKENYSLIADRYDKRFSGPLPQDVNLSNRWVKIGSARQQAVNKR